MAAAITPTTRLVWLETPTNPMLQIVDLRAVVHAVSGRVVRVVVDNTFASPYLQQPLAAVADLGLHSATKYLGGHSDVVGGLVVGRDPALRDALAFIQNSAGGVPGPFDSWLVLRGLKTLALRMVRHSGNALAVAEWLRQRPEVERVLYPCLADHPGHEVAARQMQHGFGGMVSFILRSGPGPARRLAASTKLFTLAESLGGVESLIELPAAMTTFRRPSRPWRCRRDWCAFPWASRMWPT